MLASLVDSKLPVSGCVSGGLGHHSGLAEGIQACMVDSSLNYIDTTLYFARCLHLILRKSSFLLLFSIHIKKAFFPLGKSY